jgi:hypothetical protein
MCMIEFLKRKQETRNARMREMLDKWSDATKQAFMETPMGGRQRFHFLLQMSRYHNKYTQVFGRDTTDRFFKSLNFERLESLYEVKQKYGFVLKPREIRKYFEDVKLAPKKLEKNMKKLKQTIEKAVGEEMHTPFAMSGQFHNIKMYYRYKDALERTLKTIELLEKATEATQELAKVEPVLMENQNRIAHLISKAFFCGAKSKTV